MKTFMRRVLPILVTSLLVMSLKPMDVRAQSPWFSIDPSSGPAGAGVTITGGGDFTPDQKGQILWDDGSYLADVVIDGKGIPSGSFYVPGYAGPGIYAVDVITDLEKASTTFTVIDTKPTDTPVPVPPPSIKDFSLDPQTIFAGDCATLYWSATNAQAVTIYGDFGSQSVAASGSLKVCPSITTTYQIIADGYKGADPPSVSASIVLTVTTIVIDTPTFTPSRTLTKFPGYENTPTFTPSRTPTKFPGYPGVPSFTPTLTRTATATATFLWASNNIAPAGVYIPPQSFLPALGDHLCSDLGLGQDAVRIGFDDLGAGTSLSNQYSAQGAQFVNNTVLADTPLMGAHSPGLAARSYLSEFGGPVFINFTTPVSAVGLFVGRGVPETTRAVFATLTGFGRSSNGKLVSLASDRTQLPNAESAFEECLVVHAPAGQTFSSISLNYTTATGASVVESRWFDDLTFIPTGPPAVDLSPQVTINSPANGSRQETNGLTLVARVREDIRLVSVTISLNGGALQPVGFRPAGVSNPTLYDVSTSLAALTLNQTNTIRVLATDSAGQTGEATTSFMYAGPTGDIWVNGIEVTQSIQTDTNGIPLIGNKTTLVRVYVQSRTDVRGDWNDVSATLTVRNGGTTTIYTPANSSSRTVAVSGVNYKVIPIPTAGSTRIDLQSGFYFLLDRADTAAGTREFEVNIFSASGRREADWYNNRQTLSLDFTQPLSLTIFGVPVIYQPGPSAHSYGYGHWYWVIDEHPFTNFEAHRVVAESILPLSSLNILPWPGLATLPYAIDSTGENEVLPPLPPPAFASLNAARLWAERLLAHRDGRAIIYLLEPAHNCGCGETAPVGACNGVESYRINGQDNRWSDMVGLVMAHELSHALGLWWHVVSPPEHTAYEPWNLDFPHAASSIGPQVGINLSTPNAPEVMYYTSSHDMHDIMSYSYPAWISPYDYCLLLDGLGATVLCDSTTRSAYAPSRSMTIESSSRAAASQMTEEHPSLYVSGWISPDGTAGGFDPFETIISRSEPIAPQPGGIYQVVLEDAAGEILSVYTFDVTHSDGETEEQHRFGMTVPLIPTPARISLHMGDMILAQQSSGDSIPTVTLTAPNGGEDWSGLQTITWDGNGQNPVYTVEYSRDDGLAWIPLATGLTSTSLSVDFDNMPGSEKARVRIIASDGLNYSSDQSKGSFRVPAKSPQITLDTPLDGETFTGGLPFIVQVSGFDWEDGALPDNAYTWTSDRDGALGSGPWIMIPNLSVGDHVLTATATDSQGNQTSAVVHITVIAPQVEQITPYAATPLIPTWIIIVAGIVAVGAVGAVTALVLILSRRKK